MLDRSFLWLFFARGGHSGRERGGRLSYLVRVLVKAVMKYESDDAEPTDDKNPGRVHSKCHHDERVANHED
jgi:hypothetical protein